jgi:hypothetical protein
MRRFVFGFISCDQSMWAERERKFGLQNALSLAYTSICNLNFSRGIIPQTPLNGEGRGRRRRAKKWKGGKNRGMRQEIKVYEDGRDGGPVPFHKFCRHAIDCTAYTGPQMQHGLWVPSNAPITACPIEAPDHTYIWAEWGTLYYWPYIILLHQGNG